METIGVENRAVSDLIWREDLYPRIEPDPATIQRYAQDIECCPPVEVNQHNEIIDGYHRWTAHRKNGLERIPVVVTPTASDIELLALACDRNSKHGLQLSDRDKKTMAIRLYADGTGKSEEEIAKLLSVTRRTVMAYLSRTKKELKEERNRRIFEMWLACATDEEIGQAVGLSDRAVAAIRQETEESEAVQKLRVLADYREPDWSPPIYNVWKVRDKSNAVGHFGNSEAAWVDRLLYLYTEPFDIVVDPFAGGGSTIDICKKRLRRYWVSDRLPIVERRDIRQADIAEGPPPLHKRWGDVSLLYLDPPYWKQAEGQYSKDGEDLANMPLEDFYRALTGYVLACAEKMKAGAHVALIIQPTQWNAPGREVVDHVYDLCRLLTGERLALETRISCPYESQQYNAQQVEWAKANRRLLVLSREIIVWRVSK